MLKSFALSFFIFCCSLVQAQNWKTVALHDSTYFNGGTFTGLFTGGSQGYATYHGFLRITWLDSATVVNGDSNFYFYKTVRNPGYPQCLDVYAKSWLGSRFIRTTSGTEYYFNSADDTITIKTLAGLNDSWTIAKASTGVIFQATVTGVGVAAIDGAADSVKTISLQAFMNGQPVADWYNDKVFQLSKDHGWIKTLDMYRFPNNLHCPAVQGPGTIIDSAQHERVSKLISHTDQPINIASKYAPGNEWITTLKHGANHVDIFIQHDSIVSLTPFAGNMFSVVIITKTFKRIWHSPGVGNYQFYALDTTHSYLHTDTISATLTTPGLLHLRVLPEYQPVPMHTTVLDPGSKKYFIDTSCYGKPVFRLLTSHAGWGMDYVSGNCWVSGGFPNISAIHDTIVQSGFGITDNLSINDYNNSSPEYYDSALSYTYIKLGNCIQGSKINVLGLGVQELASGGDMNISVYPNPAKDLVTITANNSLNDASLEITDMMGRIVVKTQLVDNKSTFSTTALPTGLYLVKLYSTQANCTKKLLIEK